MRDEAQRAEDHEGTGLDVREQIAEQFARYRAEGVDSAAYDECGRPMDGYYDELVDGDGRVRRMWSGSPPTSSSWAPPGSAGSTAGCAG